MCKTPNTDSGTMPLFPVFELDEKQRLVTSIPLKPQNQPTICSTSGIGSYFLSNLLDEIDAVVQRNAWWSFDNRKVALILLG